MKELIKGKTLPQGTMREWGGQKYKKVGTKWVLITESKGVKDRGKEKPSKESKEKSKEKDEDKYPKYKSPKAMREYIIQKEKFTDSEAKAYNKMVARVRDDFFVGVGSDKDFIDYLEDRSAKDFRESLKEE